MELRLQSKIFKDFFETNTLEFDENKITSIYVVDDSNVPKIKSPIESNAVIMDFANISMNSNDIQYVIFNNINSQMILKLLQKQVPSKGLRIYSTNLDYSIFNGLNISNIQELVLGTVSATYPGKFEAIKQMKELTSISFYKCDGLDLDSLFRDIPNPENLKSLVLSGNLPNIEEISRFSKLETLEICDIDNPRIIEEFLTKLPLSTIKNVRFVNCNMKDVDGNIYERFEALNSITFANCETANYNEFLDSLPNPDRVEVLEFKGTVQAKQYHLETNFLNRYTNLKKIELTSLGIDLSKLHLYLARATKLQEIVLKKLPIKSLDFLQGVNSKIEIEIEKEGIIYFNEITTDIASEHSKIKYGNTNNQVTTYLNDDGTFSVETKVEPDELYHIQHLLSGASDIRGVEVDIPDGSNGVNQTLVFVTPHSEKMNEGGTTVKLEHQAQFKSGDIDKLNAGEKLGKVVVADKHNSDRYVDKRFSYSVEEAKKNEESIKEITKGITQDMSDLDKFMQIYLRLGMKIIYDNGIIGENQYSQYAKDNIDKSRNMINGLQKDTCVCAGYADILYNCLREVGIEAHKIDGISNEYHQWNIVKIDGKYYNVDLTWDAPTIAQMVKTGKVTDLSYCLIGDARFNKEHDKKDGFVANCPNTYNRKKVKQAMKNAMDRDNLPYKKNLWEILKDRIQGKGSNLLLAENNVVQSTNIAREEGKQAVWTLPLEQEAIVQQKLKDVEGRPSRNTRQGNGNFDRTND